MPTIAPGEHGIGEGRQEDLKVEPGSEAIDAIEQVFTVRYHVFVPVLRGTLKCSGTATKGAIR
jgi:hypothetical protein